MLVQEDISRQISHSKIGKTLKVIIDREDEDYYIGRTEFDSPEVDPEVLITKDKSLNIGCFYQIEIVNADEFDLYGVLA